MSDRLEYPFGSIDVGTASRWLRLAPDDDGPVWMLNLMRYKAVADYGDAGGPAISGREADDAYAPTDILADLGATVPLFGDVTRQVAGETPWDRVGVVRYPSRASFFAMQERDDFKGKYVHKQAGMESTIVMGCVPIAVADPADVGKDPLVMSVRKFADGAGTAVEDRDGRAVARFTVDGVILGDGRTWDEVRFERVADAEAAVTQSGAVVDQIVVVIDPQIDDLIGSVRTAEGTE